MKNGQAECFYRSILQLFSTRLVVRSAGAGELKTFTAEPHLAR